MAAGAALGIHAALHGGAVVQYIAVLIFSMLGGLVPATLVRAVVRLRPMGTPWRRQWAWISSFRVWVSSPALRWSPGLRIVSVIGIDLGVTGVFSAAGVLLSTCIASAAQAAIAVAPACRHAISGGARPLGSTQLVFEYEHPDAGADA